MAYLNDKILSGGEITSQGDYDAFYEDGKQKDNDNNEEKEE